MNPHDRDDFRATVTGYVAAHGWYAVLHEMLMVMCERDEVDGALSRMNHGAAPHHLANARDVFRTPHKPDEVTP